MTGAVCALGGIGGVRMRAEVELRNGLGGGVGNANAPNDGIVGNGPRRLVGVCCGVNGGVAGGVLVTDGNDLNVCRDGTEAAAIASSCVPNNCRGTGGGGDDDMTLAEYSSNVASTSCAVRIGGGGDVSLCRSNKSASFGRAANGRSSSCSSSSNISVTGRSGDGARAQTGVSGARPDAGDSGIS